MTPLNHQTTSLFELLPVDVLGNILDQLNRVTGSRGIVNEADIPVIMRYARSLACTSKKMSVGVNDSYVTDIFLKSLSCKYDKPNEHFAVLFNTVGARKWIWSYIKEKEDDKAYQVIQEVYELASDILEEAKQTGLGSECSEDRKRWSRPDPCHYQTKQGFFLCIGRASHLATPFGEIKIYTSSASWDYSSLSVAEVFIKRLNAVFERVGGRKDRDAGDQGTSYEVAASSRQGTFRTINPEELKWIREEEIGSRKGTKNLIINGLHGNYGIYRINEVKGKKVPDVVEYGLKESPRSHELIGKIWEMLEANRLGHDPIAKKIERKEVVPQSKDVKKPLFNNISEVSQWGIEWVAQLERQPVERQLFFPEDRRLREVGNIKLLGLKNYEDARIIEILNDAAKQFLDTGSGWSICTFGYGNHRRCLDGKDLGHGLELWIHEERARCDIYALEGAYDLVIKSISQHWIRSELKDHPAILHKESEEDYVLFVKKEGIIREEDVLVRLLAGLLGLSQSIACCRDWIGRTSEIYLWVKKDALEKTLTALNIT